MKTPQEIKAEELVEKYTKPTMYFSEHVGWIEDTKMAIQCAKIAVEREIDLCSNILQELAAKDARHCHITARLQSELIEVLNCLNRM